MRKKNRKSASFFVPKNQAIQGKSLLQIYSLEDFIMRERIESKHVTKGNQKSDAGNSGGNC